MSNLLLICSFTPVSGGITMAASGIGAVHTTDLGYRLKCQAYRVILVGFLNTISNTPDRHPAMNKSVEKMTVETVETIKTAAKKTSIRSNDIRQKTFFFKL